MSGRRLFLLIIGSFALFAWTVSQTYSEPPVKKTEASAKKTVAVEKAKVGSKTDAATKFVRVIREKKTPVSLQTAIVTYVGRNAAGKKVVVDLIGAIHIADRSYFKQLNKIFDQYDVVLYELVAPKGARPKTGQAGIYSPIANLLKLADQIAIVDYEKKNFVHADMSGDDVLESMRKNNESLTQTFWKLVGQGIAQQSDPKAQDAQGSLLAVLFARDRPLAFKRMMAGQLEDPDMATQLLPVVLIKGRNKAALKVLSKELSKGKRHIAIFYGAAHMPDMEMRLLKDFKLKRGKQRWLVAWDLKVKSKKKPPAKSRKLDKTPSQ